MLFWNQPIWSIFFSSIFSCYCGRRTDKYFFKYLFLLAIFVHYHSAGDNNIYYLYIKDWKLLINGKAVKQS